MRKILVLAAIAAIVWLATRDPSAVPRAPGVLAAATPRQSAQADGVIARDGYRLTPFADFALQARILSRRDYRYGTEADLSPTDLALGWGRMSDTAVIDRLDISQGNRWYYWRWQGAPPIPEAEIIRSSANMHFIPAHAAVADALDDARAGQVATIRGKLVDVANDAGTWHWKSSRTREDTGDGACELVLLEAIELR